MSELEKTLEEQISSVNKKFLEISKNKEIEIISHFDTDGITSAAIIIKTLKKLDRRFSIKIIKSLEKEFIEKLPKNKILLFLDLGSGSLQHFERSQLKNIFIIDHHEIVQEIPKTVEIINPDLNNKEKISSSCLTYLFCREMLPNKELAKLAILGMIGDQLEKEMDKLNNGILEEGEIKRKRGLLLYPSTRPLNKTLEYCSQFYIPKVTGSAEGVIDLLRESNLYPENKKYKSIIELDEKEMERLITSIMLRSKKIKNKEIIGDIFLIKMFNKLEDAREISAKINACSKFGESTTALQFCMELPKAKKKVESIHARYKQLLLSGLKFALDTEKIKGNNFIIINSKNNIKDTMVGTIASIISKSNLYEEGTVIIIMAYYEDKIKISGRKVGENEKNVREILNKVVKITGGEVGGHSSAAGCIIPKNKEEEFINILKKNFEIELVKI